MKLGFMVQTSPYTFEGIDTAYNLIKAAVKKGHTCSLFLYMDGSYNINKNITPSNDRNIAGMMEELASLGVEVVGCGVCMQYRGVKKDMMVANVSRGGIPKFAEMANQADRYISIGF